MSTRALIWFRNDLRIHDHEGLHLASRNDSEQMGLYCFDPIQFGKTTAGFPKTGGFKAQFLLESIKQLRYNLQCLGSDLLVRNESAAESIAKIHSECPLDVIYFQKEYTTEELHEEALVADLGIKMIPTSGNKLIHPEDVVKGIERLPNGFTSFRKRQESDWKIRDEYPLPGELRLPDGVFAGPIPEIHQLGLATPTPDSRTVLTFRGGENEGLKRLHYYLWESKLLGKYKETRNGMIGGDYSSKFSPWLADGSLSPRKIYFEIKKYEAEIEQNESTYWLIFELMWRDFFRFKSQKLGSGFFQHPAVGRNKNPWSNQSFARWAKGKTGQPFIDANMNELNATGFMSNRGRQNVASYLINDLGVDWLLGAEYFESMLIDYDPASNYGNWTYLAGNGADPRGQRQFNILKQAENYDPNGAYQALWAEELSIQENRK